MHQFLAVFFLVIWAVTSVACLKTDGIFSVAVGFVFSEIATLMLWGFIGDTDIIPGQQA